MPAKPRTYPVASFGPEMMQALLRGARERYEVGPLPYSKAVNFRQRMNRLRIAMRNESHPHYATVARVSCAIVWGPKAGLPPIEEATSSRNVKYPRNSDDPAKLIIQPHDKEFNDVLVASGISAETMQNDPLDEFPNSTENPSGTSDDYLDQVLSNKKTP